VEATRSSNSVATILTQTEARAAKVLPNIAPSRKPAKPVHQESNCGPKNDCRSITCQDYEVARQLARDIAKIKIHHLNEAEIEGRNPFSLT
jgi:hypothetical protein